MRRMMAGRFESYPSGSDASRWFLAGVGKKTNIKDTKSTKSHWRDSLFCVPFVIFVLFVVYEFREAT